MVIKNAEVRARKEAIGSKRAAATGGAKAECWWQRGDGTVKGQPAYYDMRHDTVTRLPKTPQDSQDFSFLDPPPRRLHTRRADCIMCCSRRLLSKTLNATPATPSLTAWAATLAGFSCCQQAG